MLFKAKGILDFNLENITKKHNNQSAWKRTAMIKTNCDIESYYSWFIERRFNLKLNKTLRGSHISIINDRIDSNIFEEASKIFHGREITFYYDIEPRGDKSHWWLRVYCPEAEDIREAMGLTREPYYALHLTIGYVDDKRKDHSDYILRQCKKFELISNEPRKPFNQHEIVETIL